MIRKPDLPKLARKFKTPLFLLAVFLFSMLMVPISYQQRHKNDPEIIGVSFSIKYAQELGLDWHL